MSAEEALTQISVFVDDYCNGERRALATLCRIARVIAQYEAGKA